MIMFTISLGGGRGAYRRHQNQHKYRKHGRYDREKGVARMHIEG
jgi:hypothetical protein